MGKIKVGVKFYMVFSQCAFEACELVCGWLNLIYIYCILYLTPQTYNSDLVVNFKFKFCPNPLR